MQQQKTVKGENIEPGIQHYQTRERGRKRETYIEKRKNKAEKGYCRLSSTVDFFTAIIFDCLPNIERASTFTSEGKISSWLGWPRSTATPVLIDTVQFGSRMSRTETNGHEQQNSSGHWPLQSFCWMTAGPPKPTAGWTAKDGHMMRAGDTIWPRCLRVGTFR